MPSPSKKAPEAPAVAVVVAPEPAVAVAPDPNALVSIFNKNPPGGDFVHHTYEDVLNADKQVIRKKVKLEWRAPGRSFANVPRWVADLWKAQVPGIIVDGSTASKGAPSAPVSNERISALEGENVELKKRLENMEAMIAELQSSPQEPPQQ